MKLEIDSLEEFRQIFRSEIACQKYLLKCRWPNGFICPHCGSDKYWEIKTPFGYECSSCSRRTSPTAGTAMHQSHVSLQNWFLAIFLAAQPEGVSARKLYDEANVSYRSALRILRLVRRVMSSFPQPRLAGDVDAGQCMHKCCGKHANPSLSTFVFCAVEWPNLDKKPFKRERVFLAVVPESCEESIMRFLRKNVAEGSNLLTQDWKGHAEAILKHYSPPRYPDSPTFTSRVLESLGADLRTVHWRIKRNHLQSYLDGFAFHYNRKFFPRAGFHDLLSALCQAPRRRQI